MGMLKKTIQIRLGNKLAFTTVGKSTTFVNSDKFITSPNAFMWFGYKVEACAFDWVLYVNQKEWEELFDLEEVEPVGDE